MRSALFDAFKALVLERPYAQIRVEDILSLASVSRSTFYQHFDGKDDLLTQSMDPLLRVLASPARDRQWRLMTVTDHFWANRRFAGAILSGSAGAAVTDHLAWLHERSSRTSMGVARRRPERRLASRAAAHAQIGMLLDWLTGRVDAETATVADALRSLRLE